MAGSHVHPLRFEPGLGHAPEVLHPGRRRIRNVLLATDLSPTSEGALAQAIDLCETLGARLLVVNVIDPSRLSLQFLPGTRAMRVDQLRAEREQALMGLVGRARSRGVESTFLVWHGEPGHGIVSAAQAEGADLIVVGTRALDRAGRFLLGSVSDYVVNNSSCPVLIAR